MICDPCVKGAACMVDGRLAQAELLHELCYDNDRDPHVPCSYSSCCCQHRLVSVRSE